MSTPQRDNADPNTIDYIKLFFEDFPGSIRTKAADYAKIFENKGFDSKESLKGILTADTPQAKWKGGRFPRVTLFRSLSRF